MGENKEQLIADKELLEFGEKLVFGFRLVRKKLLEKARKNDETLVFSKNGKIVHIKARDIKE